MMHKKHAWKTRIDSLSALEVCASYHETLLLQESITADLERVNLGNSHMQCILDNADHNTRMIDGRNTFHVMGGIICATPASEVKSQKQIVKLNRLRKISLSAITSDFFEYLPFQSFEK